jgi:hypothetical protein
MSADKKPNPTSRLKNAAGRAPGANHRMMRKRSLKEAAKELAKDGLKTSRTALGEFWQWWHLRQRFNQVSRFSEQMVELLKEQEPGLSNEALEAIRAAGFSIARDRAGAGRSGSGFDDLVPDDAAQFEKERPGIAGAADQIVGSAGSQSGQSRSGVEGRRAHAGANQREDEGYFRDLEVGFFETNEEKNASQNRKHKFQPMRRLRHLAIPWKGKRRRLSPRAKRRACASWKKAR